MSLKRRGARLEDLETAYISVRNRLPRAVGEVAVNFFKQSWRRQGWLDRTLDSWPPRAPGAPRDSGRALLVDTGRLRSSIRVTEARRGVVRVGSDVPYAAIHNEGGRIQGTARVPAHERKAHTRRVGGKRQQVEAHAVKAHTRELNIQMPQRKFMGNSVALNNEINNQAERMIARAIK